MPTIGITGAAGQLGQEFAFLSQYHPKYDFVFFDSEELDITDNDQLNHELEDYDIDYLINCAAYTRVDQAESEKDKAYLTNRDGVANLASYCDENEILLIHFSSDYVYHNGLNRPLREDDPTKPVGVYAASKLAGEIEVLKRCRQSIVFRTSWIYSSFGNNFVKKILNASNSQSEFNIVYDQVGCPTYARDVADRVLNIIDGLVVGGYDIKYCSGVYNIANSGVTSWYDFTRQIFHISGKQCAVNPILSSDYPSPVERPSYSVLDQSKLKEKFGITMPHWQDSLVKCLKSLNDV